ncbi:D-alanyl-D-alanine carboxypeptidase family protein [Aquibacillus saliphilus]|uniref:D-alanyl-D-alanine carboxypeptidase family protein n=1 Tax=Aquibacillus saliphilus TaxID=1909422 RepID=UPI001CF00639|nr:D-alanyl-D-alanine carboxypeptidase family protein [Aquibacillus saliphilus]
MKQVLIISSCLILLLCSLPIQVNAKPSVSAQNAVLIEQSSGRVLFEKAADEPHLIASITKIMTAIIAVESGKMDEMVTASHRAVYTEGSSIYLKEGEKMKLKDLVYGLMLRSGNDSAVAIAEHVGGSLEGFAYMMNEKAEWLGMTNSHFDNPHGLDSEAHYSSAYDMGILARYAMENDVFKQITGSKSYTAETRNYAWGNKNKLLTRYYNYSTGGKTGYTKAAGRTLVSFAEKDGISLVAVTLNASDDWKDHMRLFEWGFDNFNLIKIQDKGSERYSMKDSDSVEMGLIKKDVLFPLTDEERKLLESETFLKPSAEHKTGIRKIGKKIFKIDGKPIAETSIYNVAKEKETSFLDEIVSILNKMTGVF